MNDINHIVNVTTIKKLGSSFTSIASEITKAEKVLFNIYIYICIILI